MSDFLNPHLQRPAIRWTSGDTLPAVEQTGPAAPLLIDATTGRLMVDALTASEADLAIIEAKQDTTNALLTTTSADVAATKASAASIAGMAIPANDYMALSYTSGNLTSIVYKSGGSSGTTVATLTLGYDGSNNLTSVTKS
jgi:hypothetical protein